LLDNVTEKNNFLPQQHSVKILGSVWQLKSNLMLLTL